jgi:hypothetical protein
LSFGFSARRKQWHGLFGLAATALLTFTLASCDGSGEGGQGNPVAQAQVAPVGIQVLSSKPEYVSGGSALVAVTTSDGSVPTVQLNGSDVSSSFAADQHHPGRYVGLVSGIQNGSNTLAASTPTVGASLTLTGYPISGPIIAGPQQQPFICQTATFSLPDGSSLGAATDANCNVTPRVTYLYLPVGASELVPMPSTNALPADVAMTTTSQGVTMPFVVRMETMIIDRGIYQSTVLHDPTTEAAPSALTPPRGWNGGLIAGQGVGCAPGWYVQGNSQSGTNNSGIDVTLVSPSQLGAGYALFGNTLMHGADNCNPAQLSEVAMMSKEQFVKTHGVPAFTVGIGCSGGSYTALQATDRLPGLYDGVLVQCTFPDGLSSSIAGTDARLLDHFFSVTSPAEFTADQRAAVTGYSGDAALTQAALNSNRTDPVPGRVDLPGYSSAQWYAALSVGLRYDPVANPTGARPTVYDTARNFLGVDPSTGFALRPYDNVGVQYGLQALNAGSISKQQFLDLNAQVGGVDNDANYTASRSVGNAEALVHAYQSDLVLSGGGGLASIPIVDLTGIYDEGGNYHQQWQHFALRERLSQANGDLNNYLMWRSTGTTYVSQALGLFFDWVRAYRADTGSGTQRDKVVRNRPAAAVEGCFIGSAFTAENLTLSSQPNTPCNAALPSWAFPRFAAGGPLAANILKCSLKPLSAGDYQVSFTTAEWQRLQSVFPQGVCDWSRRGAGQVPVVTHASFGPSPVRQVFYVLQAGGGS